MIAVIGVAVFAFVLGFFLGACVIWCYCGKKVKGLQATINETEKRLKNLTGTVVEQVNELKERLDARK